MTIKLRLAIKSVLCISLGVTAPAAFADFIDDASGSLEMRNFYFSRDYRDSTAKQSKREEWAQGFTLRLQSGFTEGTVGFGLDAIGMLGLKLDSSPDHTGSGLLPRGSDRRAEDNYSKAALTAKARFAKSELRLGGLSSTLPLLAANNSRLFPQTFNGGQLVSKDIDSLTFTLGRVDSVKQRDSSEFEDLTTMSQQGAYSTKVTSDSYTYGGVDYQVLPNLTLSYHASELQDFYRRDFVGLKYNQPIGPGKAFAELRYFDARETGDELLGEVDNRTFSSLFGYSINGHTFSGGYQKGYGDTAYAYVGGSDTYLFSEMQVSTFALANERVLHARYDYNFAELGVPGLTFSLRYVKGDEVDVSNVGGPRAARVRAAGGEGHEWERATDITYVVQSGALKNLSLRWRNSTNRSNFSESADEHRVIVSYVHNF
ncbi:OprD family porin [Pseudomonas sp. MMS21-TM103]|uniref:OprD family porin n=1 Tax=Pseudomonas sp. MMS21 TM103 TaxID=2886506 RepID=UPI001EDFE68C|nr:OprD family porin [Pseudomonas sp. MMS21 TM103]MCG4454896.1 OprD family porin [Pseudomonas sp. MMS21 TM103]